MTTRARLSATLCLGIALLGAAWAHAVALVGGPQVAAAAESATLRWQTDVPCGTRLQYGTAADALTQKAEALGVTAQHELQVRGLTPGTTYHYSVGCARTRLATGTFTTALPGAAAATTPAPARGERVQANESSGGRGAAAEGAVPAARPSLIARVMDALMPGKKPASATKLSAATSPSASPAKSKSPAVPGAGARAVVDGASSSIGAQSGVSSGGDVRTGTAVTATTAAGPRAPPARRTWGNVATLQDHFERHGGDFGSKSPEHYAAQAWQFLQRARENNLPMKLDDTDKTLRIFDPETRSFGAYNAAGRTKTYFKPGSPGYWQRQPGRAVKSADLPSPFPTP